MRLRKKPWARPYIEASKYVVLDPAKYKGVWENVFGNSNPIELELGIGRGKFIISKSQESLDTNFIGIELKDEVLIDGLKKIAEYKLENVRLIPMNIIKIGDIFGANEISKIYINFCNPWPKERHKKRRLTHTKFIELYKGFLKGNGEVWFKTDDIDLFKDSYDYFSNSNFNIEYITYDLHSSNFADNITTEHEEKFTELGLKTMFLIAKRIHKEQIKASK